MQVTKLNDCFEIRVQVKYPFSFKCLLLSDTHIDSKKSRRTMLKAHLDEALATQSPIFFFGDILDVMGHDNDPRSGKSDIAGKFQGTDYFDLVIKDAVEFLTPYAEYIVLMSDGNHETNVTRRYGVDLLRNICDRIEATTKHRIFKTVADGWVRFKFEHESGGVVRSKDLFFNHFNTGGKRSKGVLGADLRQAEIDADVYVTGHIHTKWNLPLHRLKLNRAGEEVVTDTLHIQLASYKNIKAGGWERTKGYYTANKGGYWLEFVGRGNIVTQRAIDLM